MNRRPRVYTASKVFRAPIWNSFKDSYSEVLEFTSSWLNMGPLDDLDIEKCRSGWIANIIDVGNSDYLICWAEPDDELSGTLVEIGAALAGDKRVILIGECRRFKTWQHHPNVIAQLQTVESAFLHILTISHRSSY